MYYIDGAEYDADNECIVFKMYNPETNEVKRWLCLDDFMPYLLTNATPEELIVLNKLFDETEVVERYDALHNKTLILTKVKSKDPNTIGRKNYDRNVLKFAIPDVINGRRTWEDDVPVFISYILDKDVKMAMPYTIANNQINFTIDEKIESHIQELMKMFPNTIDKDVLEKWIRILEYPAPNYKRISLDIEVLNEFKRIPDSETSRLPVICICMIDNNGRKIALVLDRYKGIPKRVPKDAEVFLFHDEKDMLFTCFKILLEYPFVITFNGDDFDLKYLYNRAFNLDIDKEDIPIVRRGKMFTFKAGFHIDLYKFFKIKSIQIYSFKGKYKNADLNTIGKALLNKGKFNEEHKYVGDMDIDELVKYCFRDAEITIELTTHNHDLVMNLITVLSRISRLPMENVSRESISKWIKNYMFYEHRQRGYVIPKPEDILSLKGNISTKALIKGKKYKGAIVVEPISGIHFLVGVEDFQSLYPTIIKERNLGYQTVDCNHPECQSNKVPQTEHWVCTKHRAIESIFIGAVRDLRVKWYKEKAKEDGEYKAWYSAVEQSLKVIMNASYGVFGADTFYLYCPPVAECTTAYGRNIIMSTSDKAKELGIKVLYGDTDSLFMKDFDDEKIKKLNAWATKQFDMDLDMEKIYRFVCLSNRKKNYIGVTTKGDVDVKGMTLKKKHTPTIIRDAGVKCKAILKEVHNQEEMENARNQIKDIVLDVYKALKRRTFNLEDVAFHMNLGKEVDAYQKTIPQHVQAAKLLMESGQTVTIGETITFIKTVKQVNTKRGIKLVDDVKPIELASIDDVNLDKYIEFVKSTFTQLLDPLAIDFDELIGIKKLASFLG